MNSAGQSEILLVGDSRVGGCSWTETPEWKLTVRCLRGSKLLPLCEHANAAITAQTRVVVICGILCDLCYRPHIENGRLGLLHAHETAPLDEVVNILTTWDYRFRVDRKVAVLWMLPYVPDFMLYNSIKVLPYQRQLAYLQEVDADWSQQSFMKNYRDLVEKLAKFDLQFMDMSTRKLHPSLLEKDGSDGLHMGRRDQKKMSEALVQLAITQLPVEKPINVDNLRTLRGRMQRKNHHKRAKLRKAAERLSKEHAAMLQAGAGPSQEPISKQQAGAGPSGGSRPRSVIVQPE